MKVYFSKLENNLVLVDENLYDYYFIERGDDFLWPQVILDLSDLIYVGEL